MQFGDAETSVFDRQFDCFCGILRSHEPYGINFFGIEQRDIEGQVFACIQFVIAAADGVVLFGEIDKRHYDFTTVFELAFLYGF